MKICSLVVLACLLPASAAAQVHTIRGMVRGRADGSPIAGAVITVKGTRIHATSSASGAFVLRNVRRDSVDLVIERAGIRTERVAVVRNGDALEVLVDEVPIELDMLSVTGRSESTRQHSTIQMLAADRDELERFADLTLGDVLRRTPGMVMSAPGDNRELRMRGLGSEYTQVLVDGWRLPSGSDKRDFDLERLAAGLVQRVAIVRTPAVHMPAQAVAGSVNIALRAVPAVRLLEMELGAASDQPVETSSLRGHGAFHIGDRIGDVGYLVSSGLQMRTIPREYFRSLPAANSVPAQSVFESDRRSVRDYSTAPRLSLFIGPRNTLTIAPLYLNSRQTRDAQRSFTMTDGALRNSELESEDWERESWRLQTIWQRNAGRSGVSLSAGMQGSRDQRAKLRERFQAGTALTVSETEQDERRDVEGFGGARLLVHVGDGHEVTTGADISWRDRDKHRTRLISTRGVVSDRAIAADKYAFVEKQLAAFVEDRVALTGSTVLVPGVRVEALGNFAEDRRGESVRQDGVILIPALHLLHRAGSSTNLRLAVARSTRRPRFDDVVPYLDAGDGSLVSPDRMGNPQLDAESAVGVDGSIERFFGRGGSFGLNVVAKRVYGRIENNIDEDPVTGRYVETPFNAGDGEIYGVEMDGRTRSIMRGLSLYGNVSLYGSQLRLASGEERRFNRQPRYIVNGGFEQRVRSLDASIGAHFNHVPATSKTDVRNGSRYVEVESNGSQVDAFVSKRIASGLVLRLAGRNLSETERVRTRQRTGADGTDFGTVHEREPSQRVFHLTLRRTAGRR